MKKRMFGAMLALVVLAVAGVALADPFPANWRDLAPTGPDQGALMIIPGSYANEYLLALESPAPGSPWSIGFYGTDQQGGGEMELFSSAMGSEPSPNSVIVNWDSFVGADSFGIYAEVDGVRYESEGETPDLIHNILSPDNSTMWTVGELPGLSFALATAVPTGWFDTTGGGGGGGGGTGGGGGGGAPVPEPATMLLFGTGLAGLAGLRRRKG